MGGGRRSVEMGGGGLYDMDVTVLGGKKCEYIRVRLAGRMHDVTTYLPSSSSESSPACAECGIGRRPRASTAILRHEDVGPKVYVSSHRAAPRLTQLSHPSPGLPPSSSQRQSGRTHRIPPPPIDPSQLSTSTGNNSQAIRSPTYICTQTPSISIKSSFRRLDSTVHLLTIHADGHSSVSGLPHVHRYP